jgi:peptidoglycan/LPS O-acetylase OafA/YrhL
MRSTPERNLAVGAHEATALRPSSGHVPSLDGVRGVAILLVMLCHFSFAEPLPIRGLHFALNTLSTGVDLFFVLSGFLITGILLDSKETENYYRNFYARRILRIFPLYYLAVVLLAFVAPRLSFFRAYDGVREAFLNRWWLMAYGANLTPLVTNRFVGWIGHFWSLSVEEHFYFVWPIVVARLRRTSLIKLCIALPVFGFLCRVGLMLASNHNIAVYLFTPCRMDGLVMGSWIAAMIRGPLDAPALAKLSRRILPIAGLALVGVHAFLHLGRLQIVTELFASPVAALFYGCLLFVVLTLPAGGYGAKLISSSPLRFLGLYSYGIYVFHVPLVNQLWARGVNVYLREYFRHALVGSLVFMMICFTASIVIAVASYHLYEKPFLRLKRYFGRPRGRRPVARETAQSLAPLLPSNSAPSGAQGSA